MSKSSIETINKIEKEVCDLFGLSQDVVKVKRRRRENSRSRFAMFYILREKFGLSYPTIGRIYDMDHTSVIYGVGKIRELGLDVALKEIVDKLSITQQIYLIK